MADEVIRLIDELSTSLQREMAQLNNKLDQILVTQKRHSALFTADALAVRGMERSVMQHDEAIADLSRRVSAIENQNPS